MVDALVECRRPRSRERSGSPERKSSSRHEFTWPIPPLCRSGTPRAVANRVDPPEVVTPWRPTSPPVTPTFKRFHKPSPEEPMRHVSTPGRRQRQRSGSLQGPSEQTLLDALGIAGGFGGLGEAMTGTSGKLGRSLPAALRLMPQECEEGCYWRWLSHTLLGDVAALKKAHEDIQEDIQELDRQRNEIEAMKRNRDRLLREMASMTRELTTLRVEVPKLREEYREVQNLSEYRQQRCVNLQDEQRDLKEKINRSVEWQRGARRRAVDVEKEAEDGRKREKLKGDDVHVQKEEVREKAKELHQMQTEANTIKLEIQALREAKEKKKADKKAKKKAEKN